MTGHTLPDTDIPGDIEIVCIGSVLWDVIGRAPVHMRQGSDVAGRISRLPGGVAFNIAAALARQGLRPVLLSAIGRDAEGTELDAACATMGLNTAHIYRSDDLPTDQYMAVEGANGLIAAIADAHSLEAAGARILAPLTDGRLGSVARPYRGRIALDGNLTRGLLDHIAREPAFAAARLSVAPASPGKADRLLPFLAAGRATLYVNLEEAGLICGEPFASAPDAALGLVRRGAARALVTNGGQTCADACPQGLIDARPPEVMVTRVTGAGDMFMAAHIAAEARGAPPEAALARALGAAATYVSGGHEP
ncbi:MAG: PfkB family carbohydrate kinase [Marinibacterium sp.]